MKQQPTYYDVLELIPTASASVIRAAYKSLSQRYHPDRHPPEEKPTWEFRMKALNAAYAILSDPEKRSAYDAALAASERVQRQPQRPPTATTAPPVRQPPRAEPAPPPYTPPPAAAAPTATPPKHESFRMAQPSKAGTDLWATIFGCVLGVILLFKYTGIGSWLASFDWQKVTSLDWPKWLWLGPVVVGLSAISLNKGQRQSTTISLRHHKLHPNQVPLPGQGCIPHLVTFIRGDDSSLASWTFCCTCSWAASLSDFSKGLSAHTGRHPSSSSAY